MSKEIVLTNWSVCRGSSDPYKAPEQVGSALQGTVQGHPHPNIQDGKNVITSRIVGAVNRLITTASGSVYRLVGSPDPKFVKFCEDNGKPLDLLCPIKFKD